MSAVDFKIEKSRDFFNAVSDLPKNGNFAFLASITSNSASLPSANF